MRLVLPSVKYKESFLRAIREFQKEDKSYADYDLQKISDDFPAFVQQFFDHAEGKNLPKDWIPYTAYWLIDNDEYIGRVWIRHCLTAKLEKEGGHIGYDIRPSKRRQGYGQKILELALPEAKRLGIERALVTCKDWNVASRKIIEGCGGVYQDTVSLPSGEKELRFLILL